MTSPTNLTRRRLQQLEESMSPRDRSIVETVAMLRLASGEQLRQLFFSGGHVTVASGRRSAQHALRQLVAHGLLTRLERRVGGSRSGSSGFIYVAGPAGQRLHGQWHDRGDRRSRKLNEPSTAFVSHQLACSQLFVDLRLAESDGLLALKTYQAEPDCWRRRVGPFGKPLVLKPDAYAEISSGGRHLHWFVEIDLATESQTVIARKGRAYLDHYRSGVEADVMPRVLWLAPTARRAERLASTLHGLGDIGKALHIVVERTNAIQTLKGENT